MGAKPTFAGCKGALHLRGATHLIESHPPRLSAGDYTVGQGRVNCRARLPIPGRLLLPAGAIWCMIRAPRRKLTAPPRGRAHGRMYLMAIQTAVSPGRVLAIPGLDEPLSLALPPAIEALRAKALALHQERGPSATPIPELTLIDAESWAAHTEDEDWLIWRARRCAARLLRMPLDIEPGERVVGKPRFRDVEDAEREALERARSVLSTMPPFPGGDPGHFHPDYAKLFRVGLAGILGEIEARQAETASGDAQWTFYQACCMAMEALQGYIRRVGDACEALAAQNGHDGSDWPGLAAICRRV
ncbi:MAG: hypothetical protein FJZ90_13550, partial [Chloroflexi bacterium]|nr:hypothetical protein [Chloroflexota bacterium]